MAKWNQLWRASAKARGQCKEGCGIYKAEARSRKEAKRIAMELCVAQGCHTPGNKSAYNCQCAHHTVFKIRD